MTHHVNVERETLKKDFELSSVVVDNTLVIGLVAIIVVIFAVLLAKHRKSKLGITSLNSYT